MAEQETDEPKYPVGRLKDYVIECLEANNRKRQEKDRDYYDGKQLTDEQIAEYKRRKQPPIVSNMIAGKVNNMMGIERQSRTDPKAFPRTPAHEDAAEAATDAIRYVLDNNDFDYTRSSVGEDIFIEGEGASIVEVVAGEIEINWIPWDRLIKDRHSRRRDGKDAKFLGQGIWMDQDDAIRLYGEDAKDKLTPDNDTDVLNTGQMEDRPLYSWYDTDRDRVAVIDLYHKEDVWMRTVFTGGGIIWQGPSDYQGEDGKPTCPIEIGVAFIDRDNNVYGSLRNLIDPQDEINARRSKFLDLVTRRLTISEEGAVPDLNTAKREMQKADGHIVLNPGMMDKFSRMDNSDIAAGQFNLLQESQSTMNSVGANDAVTGKSEKNSSGRALQARQQAGILELGPVYDSLRSWQKRIYRQVWLRIRQFWKSERWIRVTDSEDNLKFVGLNQPITLRQQLEAQGRQIPPGMNDPRLDQVIEVRNEVAELDVDIILEDVPDNVTIAGEQFEQIAQIAATRPDVIPGDILIEASSLRNKDQILERLRGGGEQTPEEQQAAQAQQQEEQEAKQIAKADAIAEIGTKKAKTALDTANAEAQQIENQATVAGIQDLIEAANA